MKIHGILDCERRGDILVMTPEGAFNLEGMRLCDERIRAAAAPLLDGDWARLEDLRRVELGEPAAIDLLVDNFRWGAGAGCRAIAFVRTRKLHEGIARERLDDLDCEVGYFDDTAAAWSWLAGHGFGDGA
ncbi:hypothetical protein H8E07_05350 [bacterium]|nr:hypothetical protein [bacterium]